MKKLTVDFKNDNKKLITFLNSEFPKLSTNTIYKTLRKKDIKVNGNRVNSNISIHEGDIIEIYLIDEILYGLTDNAKDVSVIYEDANIIIFNKPSNMEVEGDISLTSIMQKKYKNIYACHRIDRNTTGLVLFAKSRDVFAKVVEMFRNFEVEKHYIACVYGIPKANKVANAYLFKDSKKSIVYISKEPKKGYSKIQTSYELIDENKEKNVSILDVTLHTGKTHQIRAHLAFLGLPILGDGKYGSYRVNKDFKTNNQLLASYSMKFDLKNDYGELNYLNGKEFKLKDIPFTEYLK